MTEDDLKAIFPGLGDDPAFRIASDFDPAYNCIAFAAGDTTQVWEPMSSTAVTPAGTYWPPGVVAFSTISAHASAFQALGYEICDSPDFEQGYEKVAIYALPDGTPAHAARQLGPALWTSKIGAAEDIEHESPERLSGNLYGEPSLFLRRRV